MSRTTSFWLISSLVLILPKHAFSTCFITGLAPPPNTAIKCGQPVRMTFEVTGNCGTLDNIQWSVFDEDGATDTLIIGPVTYDPHTVGDSGFFRRLISFDLQCQRKEDGCMGVTGVHASAPVGYSGEEPSNLYIRVEGGVKGEPPELEVIESGVFTVTCTNVPALSDWGLTVLTLLVLTAGTIVVMRRRAAVA